MIYRVLLDSIHGFPLDPPQFATDEDGLREEVLTYRPSGTDLKGAYVAGLDSVWSGLVAPDLHDPRLRFWLTEAGWDRFGRAVCAQAKADGHVVKVLKRKNPRPSEVAYRDTYQVALLPPARRSRPMSP